MIPVDAITSITADEVAIDHGGEHLHGAPRYEPTLVDDTDEQYWAGVYNDYGFMPFWGFGTIIRRIRTTAVARRSAH